MVLYRKVFPVPPGPSMKKHVPDVPQSTEFITELYAISWSILREKISSSRVNISCSLNDEQLISSTYSPKEELSKPKLASVRFGLFETISLLIWVNARRSAMSLGIPKRIWSSERRSWTFPTIQLQVPNNCKVGLSRREIVRSHRCVYSKKK